MISPKDVSVLDINSEEIGIPASLLMDNAGRELAGVLLRDYPGRKVLFVLGTGNNGGDGLVAARYLYKEGGRASILLVKGPTRIRSDIARRAYHSLPADMEVHVMEGMEKADILGIMKGADVIVDGLLGSGSQGTPRGSYASAVEMINSTGCPVIAIDIPTGAGTKVHVNAARTVTFHDVKDVMISGNAMLPECGEVEIVDIGIPKEACLYVGKGDLLRIPLKGDDAHKGVGGKLLIVGGGPYTGAVILASLAAVNVGVDLVRVCVPQGIWEVIANASPDIIVSPIRTKDPFRFGPEIPDVMRELLEWADTVLIGPGMGRHPETVEFIQNLFGSCMNMGLDIVVDADGLKAVSRLLNGKMKRGEGDVLLTPHRGELRWLLDGAGIEYGTEEFENPMVEIDGCMQWSDEALKKIGDLLKILGSCSLLVKGPVDMIASSSDHSLSDHTGRGGIVVRYNRTGVPEMSVGGTGDVLSGMCAGMLAKGMSAFDSACVSAYINGRCGEVAKEDLGISLSASALVERIHRIIR